MRALASHQFGSGSMPVLLVICRRNCVLLVTDILCILLFLNQNKKSQGEQEWYSGESTRFSPIWPGFGSWTGRHMLP